MTNRNKLGLAIATAMIFSSAAFAAADDKGDSLVLLPAHTADNIEEGSVDVWFDKIDGASGYTIDLVGTGEDACADATNATKVVYEKSMFLPAAGLDCGQETEATLAVKFTTSDGDEAGVHVCKWTTPILAVGNYSIAINALHIGGGADGSKPSGTEKRGACGNDSTAHSNNNAVAFDTAGANKDKNYQIFEVVAKTTPGEDVTQVPNVPEPDLPVAGSSVATASNVLTFKDVSPEKGVATWYQLWVSKAAPHGDDERIEDMDSNPTFSNWYKVGVDGEIDCTDNANAAGDRICEIDISSSTLITTDADDTTFTWWVQGYNDLGRAVDAAGKALWSSAPGTFKK